MIKSKAQIMSIALQAIYWTTFCSVFSFAAVFLKKLGSSSTNIGLIVAMSSLVAAFSQALVGTWIDRNQIKRLKKTSVGLTSAAIVTTIVLILPVAWKTPFFIFSLILLMTLQPLVSTMIISMQSVDRRVSFGVSRAFGSLAFAGASSVIGTLVAQKTAEIVPWVSLLLYILLLGTIIVFPNQNETVEKGSNHDEVASNGKKLSTVKQYPQFMIVIAGLIFVFIFHNISNVFLITIVQSKGGTALEFGYALTLMAMIEIPVMIASGVLMRRFGTKNLLRFAMVFYMFRSFALFYAKDMAGVYVAQLLQAFSFAIYIPVSVAFVNETMKSYDRVKGQTLLVSAATLGGVAGTLGGGIVIDNFGVPEMLFIGFICTVIGGTLVIFGLKSKPTS
ncbi:MAG TPA: hypothetical protein DCS67_05270 [Clostridiales bacterium UBA8960]|nr:hypothetical protein [Clostridiales bacterium UBA8960]